jgi:hypothetical protein
MNRVQLSVISDQSSAAKLIILPKLDWGKEKK